MPAFSLNEQPRQTPHTNQKRRRKTARRRGRRLRFETLEMRRVLATISGQIAYDFDGDGLLEADEPGLEDWRVYVDTDNDGVFDAGEPTALTDAAGAYQLSELPAGFHVVRQVSQAGWEQTFPPGIGKHNIDIRQDTAAIGGINFAEKREFTDFVPGNVLVTRSSLSDTDLLLEYQPDGELVQAIVIPGTEDLSPSVAKDLVLDSQGNVQIYQARVVNDPVAGGGGGFKGYDDIRLTTFDADTQTFFDTTPEDWDLRRTFDHWGDIAAFGDYVFANEQIDDAGTANGVIRFDARDLSYERFSDGFAIPTDLTVGFDGLLYTLNATFNNTTVQAHDPVTMQTVRTFNIPQRLQSVAVDGDGNLYAVTDTGLKHFSPDGQLVASDAAHNGDDIVLDDQGHLLLTSKLGITVTDTNFSSFSTIAVPGNAGVNFLAYAAVVQAPVGGDHGGGGEGDFGAFTAGNILVSNSPATLGTPKLYEYTAFGELVQEHDIPVLESGGARDLVMDSEGRVQVYNGTFDPHLTSFISTPVGLVTESQQFAGWSTADRPTFGGMAASGNYVFATDVRTQFDSRAERGIVRYDIESETFERFAAATGDTIDINVGLDGLVYTLGPSDTPIGTVVRQYHPVTMSLLKTVNLPANHRAIAVDANGDIFAVNPDIHRYSPDGSPVGEPLDDGGVGGLADIDIDLDGRLLVAASDGHVLVTDRHFNSLVTFQTRVSDGTNFTAFVAPARPYPKAIRDDFTVSQNSQDNAFDVLANDQIQGLGTLTIDSVEQGSAGGTVTVVGNTLLQYTPAANFVGVETFTYTLADGIGNFDEAVVTVTVEGNANFFANDDYYSVEEDGTLIVNDTDPLTPLLPLLLDNDGGLDIFPVLTPGNLLVAHSPVGSDVNALLQEYTPNGTLVRSITLPDFSDGFGDVRDIVVDRAGKVQIYNGTFEPRLTTYDPLTNGLSHQTFANWNTTANVTYGGLAAWRNYVYATDQAVAGDDPNRDLGIVRFDIETDTSERFINDGNFIDVNVGLDGKLYGLGPGGTATSQRIVVFDPVSMAIERVITGLNANTRAITVSEDGDIYAVRFRDPYIYQYDSNGGLQRSFNTGLNSRPGYSEADFSDIDLHENGQDLLIANVNFSNTSTTVSPKDGDIVIANTGFNRVPRILQAPDQNSDMKFATWIQAPVGSLNGPLRVVGNSQPSHGSVVVGQDGTFTYVPDADYTGTDGFTYVVSDADGKRKDAFVSIDVTPLNDQPLLAAAAPYYSSDEDAVLNIPQVALVNGGLNTTTITDADLNGSLGGIAVTDVAGPGVWSYSSDGVVYVDIGAVSDTNALLLPVSTDIRFTPSGGAGGTASFTYRAWDRTVGVAGNKFPTTYEVCEIGGVVDEDGLCADLNPPVEYVYESYSEEKDTLTIDLSDLNDAPVLVPFQPTIGLTDEHTQIDVAVGDFVVGISDPDASSENPGIAVVGALGNGLWEYSLDGTTYVPLPTLDDTMSLLLNQDDRLRYTPDDLNGEIAEISYRAWDKTDNSVAGDIVDCSTNGGSTAFSAAVDTGQLGVSDVNDAPVLIAGAPQIGFTDVVTIISANLSDFVTGITDVDRGASVGGIAVFTTTGEGDWSFSRDGVSFTAFPSALDETSALLLHRNDTIRYTPAGGDPESATIEYVAWDATTGAGGTTVDITTRGDTTAFSADSDEATLTVQEVNDPPQLLGLTVPRGYRENDGPMPIYPDLVIIDPDSPNFENGLMKASIISGGTPNDRLNIMPTDKVAVLDDTLFYTDGGQELIGSFTIDNWVLTVHFATPQATTAAAQAVARAITYENTSDDPDADDRRISLMVTDGDVGNDTETITQTVTIQPVNDAPQADPDSYDLSTGGELSVNFLNGVLANDSDAEQDDLNAILFAGPAHGDLQLAADGSFTYTPSALYHGIDSFQYRAFDGHAFSAVTTVVLNVNLPPTNPAYVDDVNADGWVSPLDPILIANYLVRHGEGMLPDGQAFPPFLDVNGDGYVTQADVTHASNDINASGARRLPPPRLEFSQSPPALEPDVAVEVTLRTTDASGTPILEVNAGEMFYVEAWVSDQRSSPLGVAAAYVDISYNVGFASPAGAITTGADYPDFLAGRTDVIGLIDEVGAGRQEPLPDSSPHLLIRVPMQADARGEVVFTSDAADDLPVSDVLLFNIDGPIPMSVITFGETSLTITGPPVAENDNYSVAEDGELQVDDDAGVLDNDRDDDNDPLTAVLVDGPDNGTLQLEADGSFLYTPAPDFFGTDQFTYVANDGVFDSNTATVTIEVVGSNDQPVAVDDGYSVFRNKQLIVNKAAGVLANDVDADGDTLDADLVRLPDHGTVELNDDGSFTYTPQTDFGGQDQFTYRVFDGVLFSDVATVDINVYFGWQNPTHPVDVNGDGHASAIDALLVLNDLEQNGTRVLPNPPVPPNTAPPFLDVNADGVVASFDARMVIEDLDTNGSRVLPAPRTELPQPTPDLGTDPLVRFGIQTVNAQGQPATTFAVGEVFTARISVSDLRADGTGVFSAFLDVFLDQSGLSVAGPLGFGPAFEVARTGTVVDGIVEEAGGVQDSRPNANIESLLLEIPLVAVAEGDFGIETERADLSPISDVTLFDINSPIPSSLIIYEMETITATIADGDGDGVMDLEEDGAPNDGDGNNDGTPDRLQSNVASVKSLQDDLYVTISVPPRNSLANVRVTDNPSPSDGPANVQFPLGFVGFDVAGVLLGESIKSTLILEAGAQANSFYRFGRSVADATPQWYPFLSDGQTGAKIYGNRLVVQLVSGGRGDDEPATDGVSVAFAGPGLVQTPWKNPTLPADVSNDGLVTPFDVLLLVDRLNSGFGGELPLIPTENMPLPPFWDADGDNILAPSDILTVITVLNEQTRSGEDEGEGEASHIPSLPASAAIGGLYMATDVTDVFASGHGASTGTAAQSQATSLWNAPLDRETTDLEPVDEQHAVQASRVPRSGVLEDAIEMIASDIADQWL